MKRNRRGIASRFEKKYEEVRRLVKKYTVDNNFTSQNCNEADRRLLTALLDDRTPDDFSEWYVSQGPLVQNAIRKMAQNEINFPGTVYHEFITKDDCLNFAGDANPTVRYTALFMALAGLLTERAMSDVAGRMEKAKLRYEKKHQDRGHWIDAELAAAILGICKRAFQTRIQTREISFTTWRPNPKVVLFDGCEVVTHRFKDIPAADSSPVSLITHPRRKRQ